MHWMFLQSKQVELVSENNTRRAICRKQEFERLRLNKSPTEISDFSVRTKKRSEDVIIDRLNKVDVLKDAGFTPNNNNFWGLSNICHWNVIAKDEIVSAKDKVFSIRGTKKIAFRDESCKKREAMIADPTGNNWTLWKRAYWRKKTFTEIQMLYKQIWQVHYFYQKLCNINR